MVSGVLPPEVEEVIGDGLGVVGTGLPPLVPPTPHTAHPLGGLHVHGGVGAHESRPVHLALLLHTLQTTWYWQLKNGGAIFKLR